MKDFNLAKKGDKDAFSRLIENVKFKLYKTGMSILKNDDNTCDAIQETLLSAYQNLNKLEHPEYFTTWIIRIMINKCYDIIKTNKKITYINQKLEQNENEFYYDEHNDSIVEKALSAIPEELRLVTVLFYYDGICNIPEGTVKSRLYRAKEKIYAIMKEGDE